ncbi:conjugative transfer system coupling protein TraD [Aeromonas caviae]|uniref:Conjugative transfer system coupling protein TraD n=1 Tax=Aeromonas caviae TaxID=648 RepID=A0AAW9ETU4_AERCA|nr:conjugative transfer system coupling protein TraD [Aeromonas caviae]MDX7719438.1 conjugative transfer system coupling protein TraD [Aeromonas caviae]
MSVIGKAHTRTLLYRTCFEWNAALGWYLATFIMVGILSSSWLELSREARWVYLGVLAYSVLAGCKNMIAAIPILKAQARLFVTGMIFITPSELRLHNHVGKKKGRELISNDDNRETLLGYGFDWGPEHTNMSYQLMNMDSKRSQIVMPLPVRWYVQQHEAETRKMGGAAWIYNLGENALQRVRADNWYGHTLITGNVGSGKTTLLRLLSCGAIHCGNVVLAVDPKNDQDWRDAMKAECEALGIPFYSFHPSRPSTSVAIDPLRNYNRDTEIASRIAGIVSDPSKSDPFRDFSWYAIYRTTIFCRYVGERPTLVRLKNYLITQRAILFEKVLNRYYQLHLGAEWWDQIGDEVDELGEGDKLTGMVRYYEEQMMQQVPEIACDEVCAAFRHPYEHYQKMTTSLLPLMSNLTAAPLDVLLSPEYDTESGREIIDLKSLFDTGGVLHIAIDSLSDTQTAQKLVQLLVADAAGIAGSRYNTEGAEHSLKNMRRVSLFFDEAHAALCEQLLSLLAQGRAAKLEMTIVTQTIPDLVSKATEAVADRVIGLCNNWITTRISDPTTQMKMAANFSKVDVEQRSVSLSQRTDTVDSVDKFAGGYSESLSTVEREGFPSNLLGDLPKLQCVARFADGRKMLLKIPVVVKEPGK